MNDRQQPTPAELHKALFANLVMSLVSTAMQHLGKIRNPATDKVEIHLEAAQDVIDMVDMLEAKTRGNRDAEEESFLKSALSSLQMNFVETANAGGAEGGAGTIAAPDATPAPDEAAPPRKESDEGDRKRFHKSYG